MKKSLIALAALSAIAGAAQAQSSVEVYGLIDMSYGTVKSTGVKEDKLTSTGGTNSANGTGTLNGTRLGFRGTEDLGGGLKAGFVMEYGINLTAAEDPATADAVKGQTMANLRQGFVSLSDAKLGTVVAGTIYSPIDATSGSLAGAQAHGGTNWGTGAASLFKYGQNARAANGIAYVSPTFAGLTAKVGTQQAENVRVNGAAKTNGATIWALDYAQGPVKAGYAYEKIKNATVATSASSALTSAGAAPGAATAAAKFAFTPLIGSDNDNNLAVSSGTAGYGLTVNADLTYNVFGGSYNFGFATVGLNEAKYKVQTNGNGTVAAVGFGKLESTQDSVSFTVPVTAALSLGGAYTDGKLEVDSVKQWDTKAYDLLAVYTLSKRTNVYLINGQTKYDKASSNTLSGVSVKQTQTMVGVRHSF